MKRALLIITFFLLNFALTAENPEWIQYTNGQQVQAVANDGNIVWIGTFRGGLVKLDKTSGEKTFYNTANSGLPNSTVLSIAIDNNHKIWIGTENGLAEFDGNTWVVYNSTNSELPGNAVYAITVDNEQNKWIGTYNGLAKFNGDSWTIYNTTNSELPANTINCIAIDNDQNKWIGATDYMNYNGGLIKFDDSTWTVYNSSNSGLPANNIRSIVDLQQKSVQFSKRLIFF